MGNHKGDQIFHAVWRGTDATTVSFVFFLQHKTEVARVLNGLPFILADELVINTVDFIPQVGVERATFGTWDSLQHIFTDANYLHNVGNASTHTSRHKLDTLKKILHNKENYILVLAEVNIDCRKVPLKDTIYHHADGWYKRAE